MMKKQLRTAILLLLLSLLMGISCVFAQQVHVVDDADLFTPEEEAYIAELIEEFRNQTDMDFVLYTSDDSHTGQTGMEYGEDFYDQNGYGLGSDFSGILFYIDMAERYPYLITSGDMIDYMTDSRIDNVLDGITYELRKGDYAESAEGAIEDVLSYVKKGIPEGQYRYDVVTGQMLTGRHKALTINEIIVCALIGAVVCLAIVFSVNHGYSLKGSTYSYDYREKGECTLTAQTDEYLRTTRTRIPKAQPPQGGSGGHGGGGGRGSGTHVGSSGSSHGGGRGGRF